MSGSGGIQTSVNTLQAPAVVGDWCDSNPRYSVDAGPFGLVSGLNGLTIGLFAWLDATILDGDGAPARANNYGAGVPAGFVHRENQALIGLTNYLADSSMFIPAGFGITLTSAGGVWVQNAGATEATFGMKAFANPSNGTVIFAAAGTAPGGASDSTGAVVNTTLTLVAGIAGNIMTVASISAGHPYPGVTLTSNAVGQVVSQLTNATGPITTANPADYSVGTYALSVGEQTVATGTTIGGNYGLYTISGGTIVGNFGVGTVLSGTGLTAGTTITYQASGASGHAVGATFVTNNYSAATTTAITGSTAIETSFYARSTGLAGEIVKISNQPTP